jgi:hypothetical protein
MSDPQVYSQTKPFPHIVVDNFLTSDFALKVQAEILAIPRDKWDRYENPFESKWTLRDKWALPADLAELFRLLTTPVFVKRVEQLIGHRLIVDEHRTYWGVHTYDEGDKLDVHVDAGIHPDTGFKKQATVGLYLSSDWTPSQGGQLELWEGDDAGNIQPKLHCLSKSIEPLFNRLVLFTCTDRAWHGAPEPVQTSIGKRIFLTVSYLSLDLSNNRRRKAYFIARPSDPEDETKDKLRLLRADPDRCASVYRI